MLDNETVLSYVRQAKNGDNNAKSIIYKNNLPLLKCIISKFSNKGVEYDDLYQIASIGLLKAITNFDESFGVKFTTYTVPMVIGEIKRYMRDNGSIKVSRAIKQLANKIGQYCDNYYVKFEKNPTINEIAKAFNVDTEDVIVAINSNKMPLSIYEKADEEQEKGLELVDKIASDDNEDQLINKIEFANIINSLNEEEKKVIVLRYYRDKTQSEIAKDLGVSQVQISRIENRVLKKMRLIV